MQDPVDLVNAQLRAYNARDVEAYCALFSDDATTVDGDTGRVILAGIAAVRAHYSQRFTGADSLFCEVLKLVAAGDLVIVHERVWGLGDEPVETVAVYEVSGGRIRSIRFMSPERMAEVEQRAAGGLC